MQKFKKSLALLIALFTITLSFADESATLGYDNFLAQCINKEISVTILKVDNTIVGKLKAVYSDGVLIQTVFKNDIFIPRNSIGYIKVKSTVEND